MSFDGNEDEQLEALKKWWNDNGTAVIVGVSLGILVIGGWRFWQSYTQGQAELASAVYENMMQQAEQKDSKAFPGLAQELLQKHPGSVYAVFASLMQARRALEQNRIDAAETHLQWVIDNAGLPELVSLATWRKARLVFAGGDADGALALLDKAPPDKAFASAYAELRGDIARHRGEREQAKKYYDEALSALSKGNQRRNVLQQKQDNLGSVDATVFALDATEKLPPLPVENKTGDANTSPLEITTEPANALGSVSTAGG